MKNQSVAKIYVSCGHEKGIGLEVFLKSWVLLPRIQASQFILIVKASTLKEHLLLFNFHKFILTSHSLRLCGKVLNLITLKENSSHLPLSTLALNTALRSIAQTGGVLLTLPTSKDQLIIDGQRLAGHTEFLRKKFPQNPLNMFFWGPHHKVLLLTDHIPLREVPQVLKCEFIYQKLRSFLLTDLHQQQWEEVIFAGINPHAGEEGILGNEDDQISLAIKKLKHSFPNISWAGPYSGDTLFFHQNHNKKQLLVFCFHDQGLAPFKALNSTIGANITVGLPFVRLSVDHGTAFHLYGLNRSFIMGGLYTLKLALQFLKSTKDWNYGKQQS